MNNNPNRSAARSRPEIPTISTQQVLSANASGERLQDRKGRTGIQDQERKANRAIEVP